MDIRYALSASNFHQHQHQPTHIYVHTATTLSCPPTNAAAIRSPSCIRPCNRHHWTMQLNNQPTWTTTPPNRTRAHFAVSLQQEGENDGAEELGIANLGGVFFVLCVGSVFASVYGLLEWLCHVYGTARRNKVCVGLYTYVVHEFYKVAWKYFDLCFLLIFRIGAGWVASNFLKNGCGSIL